jgi:hypothetical protein
MIHTSIESIFMIHTSIEPIFMIHTSLEPIFLIHSSIERIFLIHTSLKPIFLVHTLLQRSESSAQYKYTYNYANRLFFIYVECKVFAILFVFYKGINCFVNLKFC